MSTDRAAAAPAARADGAAGEHGSGGQGRHCVRARRGAGRAGAQAEGDSAGGFAGSLPMRRRPEPGRELARWQPSWLRYSPLSFTGLAMIPAAVGLAYQAGAGAALQDSRLARSGVDAAERFGVVASVVVIGAAVLVASVVLSVLRSLVTYGNLVLRRDADAAAPRARPAAGARADVRHAPVARWNAAGAAAGAAVRRRPAGRGDDGRGRRGRGVAAAAAVPSARRPRQVLAELIARPEVVTGPLRVHGAAATRRRWTRALALPCGAAGRDGCAVLVDAVVAVAGLGGADGVLRAAGRRPVASHWGIGWTPSGWWRGRAAWTGGETASPRRASSGGSVRQTLLQRRAGVATLIAATAAGVKSYRVIDVPAELAWSIAARRRRGSPRMTGLGRLDGSAGTGYRDRAAHPGPVSRDGPAMPRLSPLRHNRGHDHGPGAYRRVRSRLRGGGGVLPRRAGIHRALAAVRDGWRRRSAPIWASCWPIRR